MHQVEVKWRDISRQYIIQRNVTRQIQNDGASRVLRLRNVPPAITPEVLSADLEHIANLHIEYLTHKGRMIVCSLNSVSAALFARTCLRSRASYKGVVIEFGVDDCALRKIPDDVEEVGEIQEFDGAQRTVKRGKMLRGNRFTALQLVDDGGEEGGEDDGDNETIGEMSWADSMSTGSTSFTDDDVSTVTETGGADLDNYWA